MLAVFSTGQLPAGRHAIPAESNFPAAVVALHGLFAVCTLLLSPLIAPGVAAPEWPPVRPHLVSPAGLCRRCPPVTDAVRGRRRQARPAPRDHGPGVGAHRRRIPHPATPAA